MAAARERMRNNAYVFCVRDVMCVEGAPKVNAFLIFRSCIIACLQ